MNSAPSIATDRLDLRPPTEAMFESVAAFFASERSRGTGGPKTRYEAWHSLAAHIGHWQMRGYGMWAVHERSAGRVCGLVGPWNPEGWVAPEIGWWITEPDLEGKGLAHEAALAARADAYSRLGWTEAFSVIAPDNVRSIALAERLGATLDREDKTPTGRAVLVYRHPAPEVLQ